MAIRIELLKRYEFAVMYELLHQATIVIPGVQEKDVICSGSHHGSRRGIREEKE